MRPGDPDLVLKAVAFLRGRGIAVAPWSNGFPLWLVDEEAFTDDELVAFALHVIRTGAHRRLH
jgi:hypothetical protein